jgi:ribosomal protein S12 methylthiotransferase
MNTFHIISLGCPKNLVDSEVFTALALQGGYQYTPDAAEAELIIINTCGFINEAKEESIDTILDAAEYKQDGVCRMLVVTGCLVRRYMEQLKEELPEVDHFVDLKDFTTFAHLLHTEVNLERELLTPGHFAYLRISDGCNNHCSYCAIPGIRGPLQSRSIDSVVAEAQSLADRGVKELIVTAQDTTQFGVDATGSSQLVPLLHQLHAIQGFQWIRLLYLHPAHITSDLIDAVAQLPKVCNYFEIPLQHINDVILRDMNRRVSRERIEEIITEIRTKIPSAVIRTTFIVGYPGESEAAFDELHQFIQEHPFERLGVFTYSPEEDTPAGEREDQIAPEVAQLRKDAIMQTQMTISVEQLSRFVGTTIPVIIDTSGEEFAWEGRSYFDAPDIDGTVFITEGDAQVGDVVMVEIIDAWEYDLVGKIVSPVQS